MNRELFIEAIGALEQQLREDRYTSKLLGLAFPDAHQANLMPRNDTITNMLIKILERATGDTDKWIDWFCYETRFGTDSERLQAYDENKQVVPMSNAGELYDFLSKEKQA